MATNQENISINLNVNAGEGIKSLRQMLLFLLEILQDR